MKRVFLGLLLFVMLFIVSACTGKDTDRETEQLTEDTSTSFEIRMSCGFSQQGQL